MPLLLKLHALQPNAISLLRQWHQQRHQWPMLIRPQHLGLINFATLLGATFIAAFAAAAISNTGL